MLKTYKMWRTHKFSFFCCSGYNNHIMKAFLENIKQLII